MPCWIGSTAERRPQDPAVVNHMIYHLAEFTAGEDTRRLLRIFSGLPERNQKWWILQMLRDPAGLPLLQYWSTLPAPQDQREILDHTIGRLRNRSARRATSVEVCCEANRSMPIAAGEAQRGIGRGGRGADSFRRRSASVARRWQHGNRQTQDPLCG